MVDSAVQEIIKKMIDSSLSVAFAESCTAGLVSDAIVRISGASQVFWGSFVSYSNDAKIKLLGIEKELIEKYGAVSKECALAMAEGALHKSGVDVALSVTGLAGPLGDGSDLPVGTVWIGWEGKSLVAGASCYQFSGSRSEIREKAVDAVLKRLAEIIFKE
jgi:PncC family amidohydrolase